MKNFLTHFKSKQPSIQSTDERSPSNHDITGSAPTEAKTSRRHLQLDSHKVNDSFSRSRSREDSGIGSTRFVEIANIDSTEIEEKVINHGALVITTGLVSEEILALAHGIFYEYIGVVLDKNLLQETSMWSVKKTLKKRVKAWQIRKQNILLQAFKSTKSEEIATLGFALGIQATLRFGKEDAVNFMLLLAETLSKVSHHFKTNCWRYNKFAVSMELEAGDYRQFPIKNVEENFVLNMRVPLSIRGRLVFLAAAQADEICRAANPQIAAVELVGHSEQVARRKCALLFRQPWCQFDGDNYRHI